jgi:hypothetical protein
MTLIVRPGFQFDDDASTYIEAVEAADTQALETATRYAINDFVIGCKQDGIWSAIKASCILAGARTLAGALVPLVGTAPTNEGGLFVSGDYNRETGLVGDGSTKYLDTGRALNADPLDSFHMAFRASTGSGVIGNPTALGTNIIRGDNAIRARSSLTVASTATTAPYFIGTQRSNSAGFTARVAGINFDYVRASANTDTVNCAVFKANNSFSSARLAFYSIGESLDLALLDARVSALITAFGVAIP